MEICEPKGASHRREKMSDKDESIEVCGVRFTADEVKSVRLDRDGSKIELTPEDKPKKKMGFQNARPVD